jgi:Domain of unknown function (DUF4129)
MFLLFGCLLFSLFANAQDEKKVIVDTIEMPPPPAEETNVEINTTPNKYFYARWDTLAVEQRNIPGKAVKELKEDEDFWYANADIKTKKSNKAIVNEREQGQKGQKGKKEQSIKEEQQQTTTYRPVGQSSWVQTMIWIIILAIFIGGLLMYLGGNKIGLFRKKNILTGDAEKDEEITEDIFAINYQKEIDKAAAQGNYRVAIRLMFLRALRNLSERNIISYKQDKTNLDYLMELHPTTYYNSFFRITRNFEYSWYGQFTVSEEGYKVIRSDFDQFDKTLK